MKKKLKKLVNDFSLGELRTGLKVTSKEFVNKKITVQFPEERTPISPRLEVFMHFVAIQMVKSAA